MTETRQLSLADLFDQPDNTQSSRVIVRTTLMERVLEMLLEGKMVNLKNDVRDKLFTGYGPLASFSAKIDMAFALGLIDAEQRKTLNHVRHIRNVFAHADELLHFNHPSFVGNKKLNGNPLKESEDAFNAATMKFVDEVKPSLETAALVRALHNRSTKETQEK